MKIIKLVWNVLIIITMYVVFREYPLFREIIANILKSLCSLIKFIIDKVHT